MKDILKTLKSVKQRAAYFAGGRISIGKIEQIELPAKKTIRSFVGKVRGRIITGRNGKYKFDTPAEAKKAARWFKEHAKKTAGLPWTDLDKDENRVPKKTALSGKVIDGFRIVTASDLEIAKTAIAQARVSGSTGSSEYVYEVAGPTVMPEDRKIVRWAIVKRSGKAHR